MASREDDSQLQLAQLAHFDNISALLKTLIQQGGKTRDALAAHEQRLSASEKHTSAENTLLMARIEALEQKSTAKVTSPTLAPRPAVPDALLIEETNKLNRRIEQLTHEQHTQAERVQKLESELTACQSRCNSLESHITTLQTTLAKLPPLVTSTFNSSPTNSTATSARTVTNAASAADAAAAAGAAATAAVAETSKSIQSLRLRIDESDKQFKSMYTELNDNVKQSARASDIESIAERVVRRLAPELCAPLLNETAANLKATMAMELHNTRELLKQVDDRSKNANTEAVLSRELATRSLPEAKAVAKSLIEELRVELNQVSQTSAAELNRCIQDVHEVIDNTCLRKASSPVDPESDRHAWRLVAHDGMRGLSDEERTWRFMLEISQKVDLLVHARENEPQTPQLSALIEEQSAGIEEQVKLVHVLTERVRVLQKAKLSTVTRAEHEKLRDELLNVQHTMTALDPQPFQRQIDQLEAKIESSGPSQQLTIVQSNVAALTGKLTEFAARTFTLDDQVQRLISFINQKPPAVARPESSMSDSADEGARVHSRQRSTIETGSVEHSIVELPSVSKREFADENPLLVLLQHRVDQLTTLCQSLNEHIDSAFNSLNNGRGGTIDERFDALRLQILKVQQQSQGMPLIRAAVVDYRTRADELATELAKIQTELLRDSGLQAISREVHAARVLLADHHDTIGELSKHEKQIMEQVGLLLQRTSSLEFKTEERTSMMVQTTQSLHEVQRNKTEKIEFDQLKSFVLANLRPRTAKETTFEDDEELPATSRKSSISDSNSMNLMNSIIAQHSRDLLNHKEWINKNATNIGALRDWIKHLRERIQTQSQPVAPQATQATHSNQSAVEEKHTARGRPAKDMFSGCVDESSSANNASALPPLQLQGAPPPVVHKPEAPEPLTKTDVQRLNDIADVVWQTKSELTNMRAELVRRAAWPEIERLLISLLASPSPPSAPSNFSASPPHVSRSSSPVQIGSSKSTEWAVHNNLPNSLAHADGVPALNAALSNRIRQLVSQHQQQQQQLSTASQYGPLVWPQPPPRANSRPGSAVGVPVSRATHLPAIRK